MASNITRKSVVVLVAVYSGIVIQCTTLFMGGILYVAMLERYPGQTTKTSLVLSLNSGFLGLLAPVVTYVTNRVSCRFAMVIGGVLLTLSGVLGALAPPSINVILVTHGIIGGIGNAMVAVPQVVVLGLNFTKHRNVVIACSVTMVAFGVLTAVPLVTVLLAKYALNGTMLMIAAINSHLCIVGVLCKPSKLELKLQAEGRRNISDQKSGHATKQVKQSLTIANRIYSLLKCPKFSLLRNGPLTLFLLSILMVNAVYAILLVHLPNYTALKGANPTQIALLTTCLNAGNMVGRLVGTAIVACTRLDLLTSHSVHVGLMGLVTLTFPYYDVFAEAKYVFAVAVGLCSGAPFSLMTPVSLQLVGVRKIAAAHGLEYFYFGIGSVVGPPIVGALYGKTGTYRDSFVFTGCLGLLGCFFAILAKHRRFSCCKRKRPSHQDDDSDPPVGRDENRRSLLVIDGAVEGDT